MQNDTAAIDLTPPEEDDLARALAGDVDPPAAAPASGRDAAAILAGAAEPVAPDPVAEPDPPAPSRPSEIPPAEIPATIPPPPAAGPGTTAYTILYAIAVTGVREGMATPVPASTREAGHLTWHEVPGTVPGRDPDQAREWAANNIDTIKRAAAADEGVFIRAIPPRSWPEIAKPTRFVVQAPVLEL